jgi:hypothetical protein
MTRTRFGWPSLDRVPRLSEAARLAKDLREAVLGLERLAAPLTDLDGILDLGRLQVFDAQLSAEEGSQEAMLVPLPNDEFAISVDPTPRGGWDCVRPPLRDELRRHRVRFRIAHEIAHTLFYARSAGEPRRSVLDSPAQEAFCDEFARALLVPPWVAAALPLTVRAIFDVQRRFDVSLEVAARSMAAAHGRGAAIALWYRPSGADYLRLQWSSPAAETNRSLLALPPIDRLAREDDSLWAPIREQWLLVGRAVARALDRLDSG